MATTTSRLTDRFQCLVPCPRWQCPCCLSRSAVLTRPSGRYEAVSRKQARPGPWNLMLVEEFVWHHEQDLFFMFDLLKSDTLMGDSSLQ